VFYSFSLQGFGQYNYPDKTGDCLLMLLYEEKLNVHVKAKCISCDFSRKEYYEQLLVKSSWYQIF